MFCSSSCSLVGLQDPQSLCCPKKYGAFELILDPCMRATEQCSDFFSPGHNYIVNLNPFLPELLLIFNITVIVFLLFYALHFD